MTDYDSFNNIKITSCDCLEKEYQKWLKTISKGSEVDIHHTYAVDFGNRDLVVYSSAIYKDHVIGYKSFCSHSKVCPYCGKVFDYKGRVEYVQGELF